jgi:hypothetical protein
VIKKPQAHQMRQLRQQTSVPRLRADFDDMDNLRATVRSWDLDFQPLVATAPRRTVARIEQQQVDGLELEYARLRVSMEQLGAPPAGKLTLAVLGEGVRRIWWRGQDVDAQTALVFPIGAELRSLSGPDFEVYTVSVALSTVELLCDRFQLPLPPFPKRAETFRPSANALAALRGNLRRLRDDSPGSDGLVAGWVCEALVLS